MKKAIRFLLKGLAMLVFVGVINVYLRMLASHVTSDQNRYVESERGQKPHKSPPSLLYRKSNNSLIKTPFEERDMLDEHGNQFIIIIWIKRSGKPENQGGKQIRMYVWATSVVKLSSLVHSPLSLRMQ